jgi:Ca2+-binding RTX toxin-like protein
MRLLTAVLGAALFLPGPAPAPPQPPTCDGLTATIVGTEGPDHLTGTSGDDVIVGLGGDDVVRGLAGRDVICGGDGADRLSGGAGADSLFGQLDRTGGGESGAFTVGDVLDGGAGNDHLDGGADVRDGYFQQRPDTYSFRFASHGVVVDLPAGTARGEGRDALVTEPVADGVVGSRYADQITGSDAADTLVGLGGDDEIVGGAGDDHLYGEAEAPRNVDQGSASDDVLEAGTGDDTINSFAGRDTLEGGPGADWMVDRSPQPEIVHAGAGRDVIDLDIAPTSGTEVSGGPGRDYLALRGALVEGRTPEASYAVDLRAGTTTLTGAGSPSPATGTVSSIWEYRLADTLHWVFTGNDGDNRVWAMDGGPLDARMGGGDDFVFGSTDTDHLHGGPGHDTVGGSPGDDVCTGFEHGACSSAG